MSEISLSSASSTLLSLSMVAEAATDAAPVRSSLPFVARGLRFKLLVLVAAEFDGSAGLKSCSTWVAVPEAAAEAATRVVAGTPSSPPFTATGVGFELLLIVATVLLLLLLLLSLYAAATPAGLELVAAAETVGFEPRLIELGSKALCAVGILVGMGLLLIIIPSGEG